MNTVTQDHFEFFQSLLGDRAIADADSLEKYGHDETEDILVLPGVVLKPETTQEVSEILSYCNEHIYQLLHQERELDSVVAQTP